MSTMFDSWDVMATFTAVVNWTKYTLCKVSILHPSLMKFDVKNITSRWLLITELKRFSECPKQKQKKLTFYILDHLHQILQIEFQLL